MIRNMMPLLFDIKVCERRLFVNQKHSFGTDFCKVNDAKVACTEPDKNILKDMANLSWFEANYNIKTESTADLFQSMSDNNWIFKGYSYLVDGEINVTKKATTIICGLKKLSMKITIKRLLMNMIGALRF